ncbi:MAG TPA: LPD38 domain-containing protein, partial [Sedimentisphaerales bacterium]|nr:LPD38 domain-containing protein [Sedimentisphaerales bacterium]
PAGGKTIGAPREIDRQRITVSMEPGGKPMAAHTIIDYMRQAFKIPVRGTATFKKKALGWFDPHGVGIRLKDVVSLTTGMHEIGHHIDWEINKRWSKTPPPAIAKELLRLGHELYGDRKPPGGYKSEGWAEFIRELLTTENAQTKAPKLYDWFHKEYLPEHKDIAKHLKKLRKMIDRWRMQGAQSRIRSQRVKWDIKSSIGEVIDRFKLRVQADWLDEFASIRIGIEKAGIDPDSIRPDKNPIILAAVLGDKAGAKAHYFATEGTTNLAGKKTGKSLKEALKPVAGEIERFLDWAHAAKGLQLYKLGINPGISEADAQYIYDLRKSSVYEQALKDWTEWSRAGLDYMVEAGALPLRVANHIKAKHPIYIPMLRAFKKGEVRTTSGTGSGFTKAGKPVKKIKGSGRPIIDPITSSLQQMEKMISASHKVMVAKSIADLADKHGVAGLIWRVPPPQKATTFSAEQIKKDIVKIAQEKLGLDLDEGIPSGILEDWDDLLTVFTNAESYRGKDNIVMVEFDGKKHWFEVNPDLYAVLEGLDQYRLPWFLDVVFGKPTRMLRLGATGLNAAFGMIRNPLRDIATFTVLAKHAKTPVAAISGIGKDVITKASGIAENFGIKGIPKSRAADLFIAMGGEMSVQVIHDRRGAKYLRSEVLASSGTQYIIRTFLHPVDAMRNAVGITEAGTRIGEFGAALKYAEKKWGKDSKAASFYALYMGQDVTTPFTRHGGIGKKVNQTVAFFNAAVQGPAKIYRTFRDRPLRTSLMAISALTVPAVWLWWKNKDKEWFKNMSEYEKYGYQHFEVLGEDDVIVRWPVPFELGHIFQTLPVAYLDQMYQRKPAEVKKAFKFVLKMANPFDVPAAAGPIIDVISNEDFAGRPIVPERNRRKLPEDQVSPYTKPLMKTIGKALNMSPAVLEHLADSYSGGVYGRVARLLEFEEIQQPADVPVIGTLFMREPYAPRAQTEAFYDERGRLTAMYGSKEITPIDNRRRIMYDRAARALTPIWKQLRNTKDKDERKKLYDEISQIVNSVNKEGQKKGRKELPSVKLDDLLDKALRDI